MCHCMRCAAFARSKSSEQPAAGDSQEQQQGPMGAAFGSRSHLERAATVKRTKLRNFLMHGFHMLVVFVAGGRIRDTQCGFKVSLAE